ncbi:vitamin K epoxide reductase complex subunit 1-like protein 1 [Leptidea sinapis]|uniref:vitamin K epoxide reductase complex subunit 1-like protein 1 n=1 Tax=Leptidea sinapis TaxID=189913 RepID=UPI0021C28A68|nr:vitamin K epoxide reductase complex subunit 1-like protein 1 [Leptidea sinapis]
MFNRFAMAVQRINRLTIVAAIVGILVSTYALYVELVAEANPTYKALCDISERASCSKVLTSKYSKGFGFAAEGSALKVPNCVYGIIFYCLMIFLSTLNHTIAGNLQLLLCSTSLLTCLYLAYLLAFVLKDFCVVCVSTYFVNISITILVYMKRKIIMNKQK